MEKKETALNRALKEQHFEIAETAMKGGEESGNLKYPELVRRLVEGYKGKTVWAPLEVITVSSLFLDARELMGLIESLESTLKIKMLEELKEKAEKGDATSTDVIAALMLADMMKQRNKDEQHN